MKMMTCTIIITTDKKIYNEQHYGLIETLCRASDIVRCDNVIELDIVDNSTGEIIYNEKKGNLPYIATALIEELYTECWKNPIDFWNWIAYNKDKIRERRKEND